MIVTPIIHRNGDTAETLIRQLQQAYRTLYDALEALKACAPNGRNFYPEPGRLQRAQAQHTARCRALRDVYLSMAEEAEAIQAQQP